MVRVDVVAPGEAAKTEADFSGEFRSDCAYIVVGPGDEPQVYLWSGDAASKKTKQRASKHATDLVESTEGAKSEVSREAQWQESEAFKELFGGKLSYGETDEAKPLEAEASQEAPVEAEAAPEAAAAEAAANGSAGAAAEAEEPQQEEQQAAAKAEEEQPAEAEAAKPVEAAAKPEAAEAAPVSPPKAEEPAKAAKASPSPIKVEPPKSGASSPTKPSGSPVKATGKPPTSPTKLQPPAPEGEAELAVKARQILTRRQSGTFVDPFEKKQVDGAGAADEAPQVSASPPGSPKAIIIQLQQADGGAGPSPPPSPAQQRQRRAWGRTVYVGRWSGAAGEPATTFTADSAKVWGGAAAAATPPEEIKFQPLKDFFSFEEIKAMRSGSGIDMTRKEDYLSEEEFTKVFGKDRSAFKAQPAWRQQLAKKQLGLF